MIEKTVLDYLIGCNINEIGENVYMEVPETPPARYMVVEKTASGSRDKIKSSMVVVQSVSQVSLYDAAQTNEAVVEAMEKMPEFTGIYSCRLNSDYNFTNTQTKEYRYQAVFDIYY